jgi:tetratricopeptide (TPR) repeat protein
VSSRSRKLLLCAAAACALAAVGGCDKSGSLYSEYLRGTRSLREDPREKSIEELERGIAQYSAEVERTVKATENLGTYYRLLAVAQMNRQMYGEALKTLDKAIAIYPENEQLSFYAAVCAGRLAKAQTDDAGKARLFALAEKQYLRTLFLYADHRSALYGLAVLYSLELNRPAEAVPLLERFLAKDTGSTDAKLLLARTHVSLGNYAEAMALYNEVAASGASDAVKQQARDNAAEIESRLTGSSAR